MSALLATRRREELAALVAANRGTVTPKQIVEFAQEPSTALHSLFTWDNDEAAQMWREAQAAKYLRAVVTMIPRSDGEPVTVRAFVSLSTDRGENGVYRPIATVLDDDDQRDVLLRDALNELESLRVKYGHLEELAAVWAAVPLKVAA